MIAGCPCSPRGEGNGRRRPPVECGGGGVVSAATPVECSGASADPWFSMGAGVANDNTFTYVLGVFAVTFLMPVIVLGIYCFFNAKNSKSAAEFVISQVAWHKWGLPLAQFCKCPKEALKVSSAAVLRLFQWNALQ